MSIEDVLRSMRALRAWQDANTPPIRIGAWQVRPWVEPVTFEACEATHPNRLVWRDPEPRYVGFVPEELDTRNFEEHERAILVAMQWKLGNRAEASMRHQYELTVLVTVDVATVYRAEADDARVLGALALFALAIRFFAWVENRVRLPYAEPRERGVAGMRCAP